MSNVCRISGKVRYNHRKTAEQAVLEMADKGVLGLESYKCDYCDAWHVGHPPSTGRMDRLFRAVRSFRISIQREEKK